MALYGNVLLWFVISAEGVDKDIEYTVTRMAKTKLLQNGMIFKNILA